MKNKLLILTALVFTLGLTLSVYAKGYHTLEAFADLPGEKQALIVETMKKNHEAKKEIWKEMKETKKSMHELLTAPEFDSVAFQSEAEKIEQLKAQKFDIMTNSIMEIAPQLTQEERENLAKMFHKGKRGHGKDGSQCSK